MFDDDGSPFRQLAIAKNTQDFSIKLNEIFDRLGIKKSVDSYIKAVRQRTFSRDGTFTYVIVGDPETQKVYIFISGKHLTRPTRVTKPRKDILYEIPELRLRPRWKGLLGYSIVRA